MHASEDELKYWQWVSERGERSRDAEKDGHALLFVCLVGSKHELGKSGLPSTHIITSQVAPLLFTTAFETHDQGGFRSGLVPS